MDKKQIKIWIFEREDKSKKKQNRKRRNTLRQASCKNKIDKKPLKMQKKTILGYFEQNKSTETERIKETKPPKPKK